MIIGAFTTTAQEEFFGEKDIEAFVSDIKNINSRVVVKEKQNKYPTVSQVLSISDLVIGCPFTSIVIEALSSGIPAFWYDPLNKCPKSDLHGTPFLYVGKKGLQEGITEWKCRDKEIVKTYSRVCGYIFDPYADGKAKERFRELILK